MVELMSRYNHSRGYCYMVDWWSLGVLIYVLCANKFPFDGYLSRFAKPEEEYEVMTKPIVFPEELNISENLQALIRAFLAVQESERLGFGLNGYRNIRSHPFFEYVDWDAVANGTLQPPFDVEKDIGTTTKEGKKFTGFDDMISNCMEKNEQYLDILSKKKQSWFKSW